MNEPTGDPRDPCFETFDFNAVSKHLENEDCGECQNQMGYYYSSLADYNRAIFWFRKAVSHNLLVAKHNLACNLYQSGNVEEGRKWFQIAANENYPASLFYMGRIYELENSFKAIPCYKRAAKLGFQPAIDILEQLGIEYIIDTPDSNIPM